MYIYMETVYQNEEQNGPRRLSDTFQKEAGFWMQERENVKIENIADI